MIKDLPLQEPLASEVTAALIDLAQLSEHAGSVGFNRLGGLASKLIERLLALCEAQRGAILLDIREHAGFETRGATHVSPPHIPTYSALALHNILEEEVYALLTAFPTADAHIHAPGLSCWVTSRFSPGEFVAESRRPLVATSEVPEGLEGLQSLHEIPLNQRRQPLQAFLVLGWTVGHEGECATAVERSHKLLLLGANAAGAVIASILLAERIHEHESTSV
jgi:hypothetical protein